MEEEKDLGMSLFDMDSPLELNLDGVDPEELEKELAGADSAEDGDEGGTPDDTPPADEALEQDNLNEGEDPEKVVEDEDTPGEGDDSDDDSPTLYSSFASVLHEQGLLPSLNLDENKITSVEDLSNAFKSEIDNQVKSYITEKLGEDGYDALEKGISLAEYQAHQDNVQTLDTVTEDALAKDLELSKKVILQDYMNQGMSQDRALRILKKSIDLGEDSVLEDAKESLTSLKAFEAKRLESLKEERAKQAELQRQKQEKIDNDLKNSIYNSDEIIKGMKLTKNLKDRVYKSITEVVGQSPDGTMENKFMRDRRENPIEFDTKLYYLYELTNGFQDFSKVVSKAQTSALSELEKNLRRTKFEGSGNPAYLDDPESYGGIGSELVL